MSASKRLGKYGAGYLILSAAVFFIGQNSTWAQVATEPVQPYVFDKDLRTLPPPPPETRKAHRPGTKPDFKAKPFRPGPPDPLWHPGRKPGSSGTLVPNMSGRLAAGVTPSEFLTPSPNFDRDQSDPNNGNNSATAAVTVNAQSDLAITKTSDQASYKPSSVVTYTVSVTNNGPSNALAVIVTDNVPDIQQALYQSDTGGCVATASPPTVLTCNLGSMPVGTSKSFNIYELIHGSQGNVSNTASVTSSTTDPNLANNTAVRTVTIGH
jgi:uncharacterized repeat protein (TIGR01451 family)